MINQECLLDLEEFLERHPNPRLVTVTTMYVGFVSCINPIKTICGAEVMCHPDIASDVRELIRQSDI